MLLVVDTSAAVSAALLRDDEVVAAAHRYDPRWHAELLIPMVNEVLAQARATMSDVSCVVAGQGPGPFTGLRVGLVTARVLASTLEVPLHGVTSLDGLALGAAARLPIDDGDLLVATDARRREVYWARYRVRSGLAWRVDGPQVGAAADAGRLPSETATLEAAGIDDVARAGPAGTSVHDGNRRSDRDVTARVGRGCLLYPDALPADIADLERLRLLDPSAADLGLVAVRELAEGPPRVPSPLYLRRPDATEPAAVTGQR